MLRSNAPLRRLFGAWLQSCLGTGAGYVALLLLATRSLHSSWAVAAVLLGEFLPAIALGSWFGALADRYSKRRLIVIASLLQAIAFAGLAPARTAAPIFGLALLAGVGNALQRPAMRSALPLLAGEQAQVAAAVYDTFRWIGLAAGPLIAAGLFALSGVTLALALNAASFFVAAAVIATVPIASPLPGGRRPVASGIRAGLRQAFASPGIAAVIVCSGGQVVAGSILNVCEPLFATRVLRGSASDYALLVACYGVGMVAASLLVARRGPMSAKVLIGRYLAALVLGAAGMLGSALVGTVVLAGVTFAVTGYANALLVVSEAQLILLRVPSAVQGRLFGAKDTFEGACILAGLVGAAGLVAATGVRVSLASAGAICAGCAIAGAAVLLGRRGDAPAVAPSSASEARASEVEAIRSFR
jgi:MFS family permease